MVESRRSTVAVFAVMYEAATYTYVDVGAGGGQFLWRTTLSGERIARMRRVRTTRRRKRPGRSINEVRPGNTSLVVLLLAA
jgi:hypothetical protein